MSDDRMLCMNCGLRPRIRHMVICEECRQKQHHTTPERASANERHLVLLRATGRNFASAYI